MTSTALSMTLGRCSKKYWRYLFWFLLNCCIVNAFILYKLTSRRRICRKRFTHLDFRLELVRELVGGFCKRKRAAPEGRGRDGLVEQMNMGGHVMSRLSDKTKTCKYHTRYLKQRKETKFGCATCGVHLCQDGCFARYHNL
ncbi:piggyBac transposable element-derived protein 4-like [Dreissena polymorpha]|uniref:piggyBac transposable element-derived protein 4-like n=1 Tax=Dreissena polymorpha TaxID=45954 RepID=UPI002263F472|nr:piggyBac transposable element-derived protein 4-like [Dreissena polymorpha]